MINSEVIARFSALLLPKKCIYLKAEASRESLAVSWEIKIQQLTAASLQSSEMQPADVDQRFGRGQLLRGRLPYYTHTNIRILRVETVSVESINKEKLVSGENISLLPHRDVNTRK